jgi:hypothetical protein
MIFVQALQCMASGKLVSRPSRFVVLSIQRGTVAFNTTGLIGTVPILQQIGANEGGGNWFVGRWPVACYRNGLGDWIRPMSGEPHIFTDDDVIANDWEIVE